MFHFMLEGQTKPDVPIQCSLTEGILYHKRLVSLALLVGPSAFWMAAAGIEEDILIYTACELMFVSLENNCPQCAQNGTFDQLSGHPQPS